MVFLISLALALLLVLLLGKQLRTAPGPFYLCAALLSLAVVVCAFAGVRFPAFVNSWIWPIFARGALAGALFVLVMVAGAFPNGSRGARTLMPVRGPLSILAGIFTLAHNVAYGKTYFVLLFTDAASLPTATLLAALCSVVMDLVMLPLWITSFPAVRKKMRPKAWKRLQRWAYLFYALLCLHILLLTIPNALRGRPGYGLTVFVYTAIFVAYAACRILKALARRRQSETGLARRQLVALFFALLLAAALTLAVSAAREAQDGEGASAVAVSTEPLSASEAPEATESLPSPPPAPESTDASSTPEPDLTPEVTPTASVSSPPPDPEAKGEAQPEPEPTATSAPTPEPETAAAPEPTAKPAPKPTPEPTP